ncbi:hypothetical protein [Posidoniimonas corsicana]|uniref:hypothetical protein n=1 Tax=Posidoniimonas corsicana TaxID=1938618 RepID=UPI0036F2650A
MIAAHTTIIPANHRIGHSGSIAGNGVAKKGIDIGQGCWIGCGVRVLDGVSIGDRCVVGAGAVVRDSIPAQSVAVGVPARAIKDLSEQ